MTATFKNGEWCCAGVINGRRCIGYGSSLSEAAGMLADIWKTRVIESSAAWYEFYQGWEDSAAGKDPVRTTLLYLRGYSEHASMRETT